MAARYTLVIGNKNVSSWSLRPWLAMKMAKLAFDELIVPLDTPQAKNGILAHSPSGKVPALVIVEAGKRQTVWDSLAICETIAEHHPGARLWPKPATARAAARSIVAEMHSGFAALRNALPMDITARRETPALNDATQGDIARVVAIWTSALERSAKKDGFLFGHFTIADAFYAPVATRFRTYGIKVPKTAQAYAKRLLALPAMREWEHAAKIESTAAA